MSEHTNMEELLKEMDGLREVAARNPIDYPRTQAGIAAAAALAKTDLVGLEEQYAKALAANSIAIFPSGEGAENFAAIAAEGGVLTLDAMDLYRRLADHVELGMTGNREFGAQHAGLLIRGLKEIGNEMGLREMVAPRHPELPIVLADKAAVTEYLKGVVTAAVGDDLNLAYLAQKLTAGALSRRYHGSNAPVIVTNVQGDEGKKIAGLFAGHESLLITHEIDKDFVQKAIATARKRRASTNKR